ncbi:MAG TPA: ATP-binding protein [Bacteroidia bacterium]|jgi:signal transduction histidine kinase/CheY-like chemotaxis protein|nr:ATP-binding protein [Bacteroidia bacterium]
MRFTATGKALLGFTLITIPLGIALFFTYNNLGKINDSVSIVGEPNHKLLMWKSVLGYLDRAQSLSSKWKIDNDQADLEGIDSCRSLALTEVNKLPSATAGNSADVVTLTDSLRSLTEEWFVYIADNITDIDSLAPGQAVVDNILRTMAKNEIAQDNTDSKTGSVLSAKNNFWHTVFGKRRSDLHNTADLSGTGDSPSKDHVGTVIETSTIRKAIRSGQEEEQSLNEKRLLNEMSLLNTGIALSVRLRTNTVSFEKIINNETANLLLAATKTSTSSTRSVMIWMSALALCFIILFAGVIQRDVVRNRKLNAQLDTAKTNAEHLAQAKEEFLANMSHEIRTPLNIISGFSSQLLKSHLNNTQRLQTEGVHRSSEHLMAIVNDILDYSKMQSGKMVLEQIGFRISDLEQDLNAAFKSMAEQKGIAFEMESQKNIPPILVGDPVRIRQVLFNLVSNAIKFTDKGHVHIGMSYNKMNELNITVSDTGIGITSEKIKMIFDAFTQADSSISRRFGGTGLGLSITHFLVSEMKGSILVDSTPGRGTDFLVKIPLQKGSKNDLPVALLETDTTSLLHGKTVLVCDDESMNRILAAHILEAHGATVLEASDGEEAIAMLHQQPADLVLMDLQMPGINGNEATTTIRSSSEEKIAAVKIIAVTGKANPGSKEKCLKDGMNGFITKPYREEQLIKEIRLCLLDKS